MEHTRVCTLGLSLGFGALVLWNWELIRQTFVVRLVDAGTWAFLCF